jgi:hypothetical protein
MTERIRTVERIRALANINKEGGKKGRWDSTSEFDDDDVDDDRYCMRGLEPFQNEVSHDTLHSKRKLHKSTVIMEQHRQSMLGLKDPDRFRILVQSQSSLANFHAIQLAAIDQYEVYPERPLSLSQRTLLTATPPPVHGTHSSSTASAMSRRRFSLPGISSKSGPLFGSGSNNNNNNNNSAVTSQKQPHIPHSQSYRSLSSLGGSDQLESDRKSITNTLIIPHTGELSGKLSLSPKIISPVVTGMTTMTTTNIPDLSSPEMIRKFQERNARRLMEIYKPLMMEPGSSSSTNGGSSSSMIGKSGEKNNGLLSTTTNNSMHQNLFRFSLRRDSLSLIPPSMTRQRLYQQQQLLQQQEQRSAVGAAMMASSRFPIRRDSLSHVHHHFHHDDDSNSKTAS